MYLHKDMPFTKDFFKTIETINIIDGNEKETKKWLSQRGLPDGKLVYLSWDPKLAMIVPWNILIKYFDSFYYSISDDLTIIDESLKWAVLFFHENQIYFGTKEEFEPIELYVDEDLS
jgi:hypothetical protein